jgi:hypothetical protein
MFARTLITTSGAFLMRIVTTAAQNRGIRRQHPITARTGPINLN